MTAKKKAGGLCCLAPLCFFGGASPRQKSTLARTLCRTVVHPLHLQSQHSDPNASYSRGPDAFSSTEEDRCAWFGIAKTWLELLPCHAPIWLGLKGTRKEERGRRKEQRGPKVVVVVGVVVVCVWTSITNRRRGAPRRNELALQASDGRCGHHCRPGRRLRQ
ncbi:hypothetical protein L1887_48597 [Cichorium endivia]|nr:hypothetical protein L1887_48597 [Cichorium endivia]